MIQQIIDLLNNTDLWHETDNGYVFELHNWTSNQQNTLVWLLQQLGIQSSLKLYNFLQANLYLSHHDFQNLKSMCQPYVHVSDEPLTYSLTGWYSLYNDITDKEWDIFRNNIYIKYNKEDTIPPQTKAEKYRQELYTKKLVDYIRSKLPSTAIIKRIVHEFALLYTSKNNQFNPTKLVIDMSLDAMRKLTDKKISGYATWNGQNCCIHMYPLQSNTNKRAIFTFFHELRHSLQYNYQLFSNAYKYDGIHSSCQNTIRFLATEAEAKAQTVVIEDSENAFIKHLKNAHEINILKKLQEDPCMLPIQKDCPLEQKLVAIKRYIQAKTEEQTIQTLCSVLLANSRVEAYHAFNKNDIHLTPSYFNIFMKIVENWKKFYFNEFSVLLVDDLSFAKENNPLESLTIQERWLRHAQLKLDLEPTHIFSKEVARNLGIYESIYGYEKHIQKSQLDLQYVYHEISPENLTYVHECLKENRFSDIFNIYDQIQQCNSYFPPSDEIKVGNPISSEELAKRLINAMQEMINHNSPDHILKTLGYDFKDEYDAQDIKIKRECLKQNDLINLLRKRLNSNEKSV